MRRTLRSSIFQIFLFATLIFLLTFIAKYVKFARNISEPAQCNCTTLVPKVIIQEIIKTQLVEHHTTVPPLPPCTPVDKNSAVQRAIVIYYPSHQYEYFFPEVRWLYRSWAEMLREQPPTWRTDFVIFTYNFSADLRALGCVNHIRQNKEEQSICRVFLYVPVKFRTKNVTDNNFEHAFDEAKRLAKFYNDSIEQMVFVPNVNDSKTFDSNRSQSLYDNLEQYGYVDSINTLVEGYNTFKMYDFILRTDIDVFIYRHFATYIPQNCTIITGGGGYGTDFNRRKLKRISVDMGFTFGNVSGMGSTWYGSPHDGFMVANLTMYSMLWLSQYEFATPERKGLLGTIMWPEWHYGVLLLYGQHLAINHLVGTNQIRMIIGSELLDQSSTDATSPYVQQSIRLNLHCWHTDLPFSKFVFKMGRYNISDLNTYRNETSARSYAMRMALESKYMTLEQLANFALRNGSAL